MSTHSHSIPQGTSITKFAACTMAGAALITLGAKTQIPFWPVPMTLHTLAVFWIAVSFGPRLAFAAMATYLAAGAAGAPVFSGSPERGIGLAYMFGPTGGYLLGYLAAAGLIGWLARGASLPRQAVAMLVGLATVYALGLAWLGNFVPARELLAAGLTPFLAGDLLKIALVCALAGGWQRLRGGAQ